MRKGTLAAVARPRHRPARPGPEDHGHHPRHGHGLDRSRRAGGPGHGQGRGHRLTRTTTTNASGIFSFAELPVGTYQVEVALSGFKSAVVTQASP